MPDDAKTAVIGAKISRTGAERDAFILGKPPRILPLKPEEFTPEVLQITAELRAAAGAPPDSYVPDFVATMLRYPELCRLHSDLAMLLMARSAIPSRERELAVLRVGWLCQAPFEWAAHVEMAQRVSDINPEEIERMTIGASAPGWSEHDRAVIRAVEEMFEDAMISDETWEILAKTWNDKQLLELPILIGQYIGVAFVQNSLRVRLMPGHKGLVNR